MCVWAVSVGINMNVFRIELEKTRRAFKAESTFFEKCELRNKYEAIGNHEDDLGLSQITAVQPQKGAAGKSHWILRSLRHPSTVSLYLFVLQGAKGPGTQPLLCTASGATAPSVRALPAVASLPAASRDTPIS